jgi:predicted dehydrogenase
MDAAIIATPTRSHFDIAEDLLSRGIHCLIEKPITDCPYQAKQLVEIAEEANCVLSVGHVEQFNPAIRFALEKVGTAKFVQACRASSYTYRSTDIGVVHDLMIHDIDLVNAAFPGTISKTDACGFNVFGQKEDIAQARLEFDCGGVASLTAPRCSFDAQRSLQIFGTDGFASVDLANHQVKYIVYPEWMKEREFDFAGADAGQREFVKENLFTEILCVQDSEPEKANAILEEQRNWVNCVLHGSELHNRGENAAEAVRIAEQVLQCIAQHQWFDAGADTAVAGAIGSKPMPEELRAAVRIQAA